MFSTARLMSVAIRPVSSPTRNASNHFKNTYCKTCVDDLLLQSCLKRSFSLILHPPPTIVEFCFGEETKIWNLSWLFVFSYPHSLVVQAFYVRDLGPNYGQRTGWKSPASLEQWLTQWIGIALQVPLPLHVRGGGGGVDSFCNLSWIFLHQSNPKLQRQNSSRKALMEMEVALVLPPPPFPLLLELKTKKDESSVHIYL